jgi:hypothetical protein
VWLVEDPELGPTVRRRAGAWTPAVHELLEFLAASDLPGVPRVLGLDGDQERLSYLPGESIDPDADVPADAALAGAAAWLRHYHDVVAGFPAGERVWRRGPADVAPGQRICHNDTGVYNWIVGGGGFAGMIDWDQAGPGAPIDDLAFLVWTGVPLHRDALDAADTARRVRLAAEAYGGVAPGDLLDAVADRMLRAVARIAAGIERGDPGMLALREHGEPQRTRGRVEGFLTRLPALRLTV